MRKLCVISVLGFILVLLAGSRSEGQGGRQNPSTISVVDTSKIQVITVGDGTTLIGRVVRVGADSVEVETNGARVTLSRTAIRSVTVRPASAIRNGEYWVQNP
ncbi:MAG: hypothetical protein H0U64_00780, partial [Gemmatimonadaceae bacterium]|nr:hypothetical protein [Gemmatimonadaceae bacterium]